MKNQTAYLVGLSKLEIRDSVMPVVSQDDLLIEVKHVGICGSDVRAFARPEACIHPPEYPVVLGHESAGVVVGWGANVKGFRIGDKVAMEPGVPCGKCSYCLEGRYNLCADMDFMACYPWKRSALNRYIAHPAMMCFKLPEPLTTLDGALLEPFSVGMHAAARANVGLGETAVVLGAGCIGLMTLCACRARGASCVIAADLYENRLRMADELGADCTVNSAKEDLEAAVMQRTGGRGADVVFEAAGSPHTLKMATKLVKRGGKIVLVGSVSDPVALQFYALSAKEIDILSVFRYRNMYPLTIAAIESGSANIRKIATHLYPFAQVQNAFDCACNDKQNVLKAVVEL